MNTILIFLSAFFTVFLLGFQHFNVHHNKYVLAGVTSCLISLSMLLSYKLVPNGSLYDSIAFVLGGPFGILCSMLTWDKLHRFFNKGGNYAKKT